MSSSGPGNALNLKSLEEIPENFRGIFREYKAFNAVQSKCFDDVFYSEKHIVLGAPTSSGKTVIFELAVIRLLQETQRQNLPLGHYKMVYVAPIKALCKERFFDWEQKFRAIGIKCKEATGDNDINDLNDLEDAHLILTTPEKWDSLTRKWRENRTFVDSIKLFMVDEIHLLNEPKRGPTLEAIISRMKTIYDVGRIGRGEDISVKSPNQLRFVAVSATIPNIEDLAQWLGHGYDDNIKYFAISEDMRPIKLKKVVLGYECSPNMNYFRFDMNLNYQLLDVINRYSNGKPTLIFCSTRRGVEMASNVLVTDFRYPFNAEQQQNISQIAIEISDTKLRTAISKGIAFHHAGLATSDRTIVENAFRQGKIPVLLCTSTLAMGINLPAHLVIIKSTQSYQTAGPEEISQNTVLQMIGRAGRPQFDESGVAVIMTQQNKKFTYERLVCGTNPIESHLHKCLAEHLNSEIVLQTITDLSIAVQWIKSTFFYVRACKNPLQYGITVTPDKLEKKLEEMCLIAINALERHKLITKNEECVITSTPYGRLMARYYINFETMKLFGELCGDENLLDIVNVLTRSAEFGDFKLRNNDKRTLNDLNRSKERETIRFEIKGRVMTVPAKISCLIQAVLGNLSIVDSSLNQEATKIIQHGERLTKCLYDYLVIKEKVEKCGNFGVLSNAAIISKCFEAKLWEDSKYVTKQFKRIGPQMATTLKNAEYTTIESIVRADPRKIELLINKAPPFGNDIRSEALRFPSYELQLSLLDDQSAKIVVLQCNKSCDMDLKSKITLFIGDNQNNLIFYRDEIKFLPMPPSTNEIFQNTITFDRNSEFIVCKLIHKTLVGVDKSITVPIKQSEPKKTQEPKKKRQKKTKDGKVTDYFKKKKKTQLNNSEYDPNETVHVNMDIVEDSGNYDELFKGTGIVAQKDESDLGSTDEEPNYEIMEVREPDSVDDGNLTVSEGELIIEPTPEPPVLTKKNSNLEYLDQLLSKHVSPLVKKFVFRPPKNNFNPTQRSINQILSNSQDSRSSELLTNKFHVAKPLAEYLPKPALAPTVWTLEEEEKLYKAFNGSGPVNSLEETLDSTIEDNLMVNTFVTAKKLLEKDIIRVRGTQEVVQKVPEVVERVPEETPTKNLGNISYLNSFFMGNYSTPTKENTSNQRTLRTKTLSEFRQEMKEYSPNVSLATDYLPSLQKESSKMDFVDFDDFMNDEMETFHTPIQNDQRKKQLSVISAKNKGNVPPGNNYYCNVLSQLCDDPSKAKLAFDPSETWKSIGNDSDYETGEDHDGQENVDEERIKEQMKKLEALYVEPLAKKKEQICSINVTKDPLIDLTLVEKTPIVRKIVTPSQSVISELLKSPPIPEVSISKPDYLNNFTQFLNNCDNLQEKPLIEAPVSFEVPLVKPPVSAMQENSFKIPFLKQNKTLGMRRTRMPSTNDQTKENFGPSFLSASSIRPQQLPYYVPALTMSYKQSSSVPSKVNPLKLRQSFFAAKPARMGSLETAMRNFRNSLQSEANNTSSFMHSHRQKQLQHSNDELNNLAMFKNVTLKSFVEEPVKRPPIKMKAQNDPISTAFRTSLMETMRTQVERKRAAPSTSFEEDQELWWMQPPKKKQKNDEDEFFEEKFFDD